MRKALITLFVIMALGSLAQAQTVVNLSVTDTPDNQTWNSGTWSVQLIPGPGNLDQTRNFTLLVAGGSLGSQSGSLSSTGTASMSLPANVNIGPVGTKWQFTVCSQQGTACSISNVTVVTSSPQAVALTPPSIRVAAAPNLPPVVVYTTTEISSASIGSQITVVGSVAGGTPTLQSCTAVSGSTCTAWSAAGGVPGQFNVKTYGAVGDAKHTNNGTATAGSSTITSSDNPWIASDAGKVITCAFVGVGGPTNAFALGTKILTFNSAGSVTLTNNNLAGNVPVACTWATQDETTAFRAAFNAAQTANNQQFPSAGPNAGQPSVIYIPPGGYLFNGNWYDCNNAAGFTLCPGVFGAGWQSVMLYPSSTFTPGQRACFMDAVNADNLTWRDFSIFGDQWTYDCGNTIPFIRTNSVRIFDIRNIRITNVGTNDSGHMLDIFSTQEGLLENLWLEGAGQGATGACLAVEGSANITLNGVLTSNCFINEFFSNSGVRNASGGQVAVVGGFADECGANPTNGCVQLQGSIVDFIGGAIFGEPTATATGALQLDATSVAYLTNENVGPFSTAVNSNGIGCASGAQVIASGSTIRGGGTTGLLVSGPASGTCTFVDEGGNSFSRWNSTTGTTITPALFSGAFGSTVTYKASITHTPNTCYAVTGNLLATAQNLCTLLLDQHYQVVNITAQSGGTTPATSSCTGAPVITLSDGTRTATLTMTTGKTAWSSAVDASSVGAIMASGTTLTVSIGANTCATPPANVSVNYVLQSAINP